MCGQWGETGIFKNKIHELGKDELTEEKWLALTEEAAGMGAGIHLWGGEPLLKDCFAKILRRARELGAPLSLVTNATLLERHASAIIDSGARIVFFSLDGDGETHDSIRGMKGAFAKIRKGVETLIRLRGSAQTPYVVAMTVIQRDNQHALPKIAESAAEMGVDQLLLAPLMFIDPETHTAQAKLFRELFGMEWRCSSGWDHSNLFPDTDVTEPFLRKLPMRLGKTEIIVNLHPEVRLRDWRRGDAPAQKTRKCIVPLNKINIMPNGDCNFCVDFPDYVIGNVKDASLADIWRGPKAEAYRAAMEARGPFPVCLRCAWLQHSFTGLMEVRRG
jgi:radical SAM protein with 4Fe4S-binding SPASM domain